METVQTKFQTKRAYLNAALLLSCLALFIWSFVIEPASLVVRSYPLTIPNWPASLNGFKVALIADLHLGSTYVDVKKVGKVVDETNKEEPDLTILLGDYISTGRLFAPIKPSDMIPELSRLKAKHGVYAILGNHDWWYNGAEIRDVLEAAHISVLENSCTGIMVNGQRLWIAGLADLWTRQPAITQTLRGVTPGDPILLLSHNPDVFPSVPDRINLTLAGHTHGGQVALPFYGAIIVPSVYGRRYGRGHVEEKGRHLFVSTGIGTTALPVRFFTPPEISVLILNH